MAVSIRFASTVRSMSSSAQQYPNFGASSVTSVAESQCCSRDQATAGDGPASGELSLALLWRELARGVCKVVDSYFSDTRCFLATAPSTRPTVPIEGRSLQILQSVLMGVAQKTVAIDMAIATSTVALGARQALDAFGLRCRPSRVHPLLMLAAKAEHSRDSEAQGSLSYLGRGESQLRVISVLRPDRDLTRALPPAQLAVARGLVEGACYEEIARRRGTSVRTVANQVTAVFRRLRVSGRSELLWRLFSDQAQASVRSS